MNVLQVIPELETGGAERTTVEVAEALVREGHTAIVASAGGAMARELEAAGGRLVTLPLATKNPLTAWANAGALERLIRAQDIDLVHARSRAPAWSALRAARAAGVPFVTTYHGTYTARHPLKRLYNSVMARGDRVIANSEFIRDHIVAEHGLAPDAISVIPRGVDIARFEVTDEVRARGQALAKVWGVPKERFVALLPARLTRWKGQLLAVEALARLKPTGAPLPLLVLAGDDQGRERYRGEIAALVREHGLENDVILTGHCHDMPAAFALADVALNPSIEPEAFGRTAAEASAAGRPVIVADHGGAREVVDHNVTGWRIPPGDAGALAKTLQAAQMLDTGSRAAMGAAGRKRVMARFTVAALQESTLRVYRELLE
ncbi:glycosyltransferase family 4 protein [Hyphobacterium sp.]|jgi:glycosyltransferase involved in cell wall biosynthesis|uniref:glycosyltransferase family 4 protein n=1 Tax=Hyphobacterium sp. TaxID=2004662 RepID=UPI003BA90F3E